MALIGYARVSVLDEETWHQHDALEAAGCARIFTDRSSGAHEERPELARCFDHLREGDTLVVARLDRIGRSLRDLVDTTLALGERGIALRSLDDAIDTTGPDGPAVLVICETLAAFELELVRERTALAATGVREPRLGAFVEAARSLPSRRSGASAAPDAEAPPPAPTRSLRSWRSTAAAAPEAEAPRAGADPRPARPAIERRRRGRGRAAAVGGDPQPAAANGRVRRGPGRGRGRGRGRGPARGRGRRRSAVAGRARPAVVALGRGRRGRRRGRRRGAERCAAGRGAAGDLRHRAAPRARVAGAG